MQIQTKIILKKQSSVKASVGGTISPKVTLERLKK